MRSRCLLVLAAITCAIGADVAGAHEDGDYRWVRPPGGSEDANVQPEGRRAVIDPDDAVDALWTPDLQLHLQWEPGALGDAAVRIDVEPLDAATLGRLPGSLEPAGNAYRIALDPDVHIVPAADVRLRVPHDASSVLWSADGTDWMPLPEPRLRDLTMVTSLETAGFVVAAAPDDARPRWRRLAPFLTWGLLAGGCLWLAAMERGRRARRQR